MSSKSHQENLANFDMAQSVMTKIDERHIKMKPRSFFIIGSVLLLLSLLTCCGMAAFFIDLIRYRLYLFQPHGFLRFGLVGLNPFIQLLTWEAVVMAVAGVGGGIYLLSQYDISYKKHFGFIAALFIIFIAGLAFLFDIIRLDDHFSHFAPLRIFYQNSSQGVNWVSGHISAVSQNTIWLTEFNGRTIEVTTNNQTRVYQHSSPGLQNGETVEAIGNWQNNNLFTATALRDLD